MHRIDKGCCCWSTKSTYQDSGNGNCGSKHSTQVWHALIQILGSEDQRHHANGLDISTITVFGEQRRLYREKMAYMVRSKDKPQNFPISVVETELGSTIIFNELTDEEISEGKEEIQEIENQ